MVYFQSTSGPDSFAYGNGDWLPVLFFETDRAIDSFGIYNPSSATWGTPSASFSWGPAGAIPVPADYTWDGNVDRAAYLGGWWYIKTSTGLAHGAGPVVLSGSGLALGAVPAP